jgi:4-amino-4-deoxy-L-arabinose transferase-like glycosyltransferase
MTLAAFNIPGGAAIKSDRGKTHTNRGVLWGLAAYFLLSIIFRIVVSGTADMDETEQLVYTQTLRLGYGTQLPLYTWLQHLSFTLFGVNLFALSMLKYTLLFSTYVCVLKIAQKTLNESMGTALATLSLFLIPQVAWESYRTLSNTVLATFMAALTLLLLVRLREKPIWTNYLLLGTAAGLGMLSKYNYAIFLVAIIAAGISTPGFRKAVLTGKSLLSLFAMLLITVPPYAWIVMNMDRATASSKKLQALGGGTVLQDYIMGFSTLIAAGVGYFWPALIVYAILYFLFKPVRTTDPDDSIHLLLTRTLMAAFAICSILILIFRVTYFKERWLQPFLFFLPIFFVYYLSPRIDGKRFKGLIAATLIPAFLAMLAFSGSVLLASKTGRTTRLSPPYRSMATHILQEGFEEGTIITNDHRIGGNFRLSFKGSTILVPGMMEMATESSDPTLVLWNAERSEAPPEHLVKYVEEMLEIRLDTSEARYVEKPMLYWKERTMRLGYFIIK